MGQLLGKVAVIVVTHNSDLFFEENIRTILNQTVRSDIYVVDSGSSDVNYIKDSPYFHSISVRFEDNIGFGAANNIAIREAVPHYDYILLINPDLLLPGNFIEGAVEFMDRPYNADVGCMTGVLLGFDIANKVPTGKYDSTGLFRKWYGRWYDRYQGVSIQDIKLPDEEDVPAICGALMFFRSEALASIVTNGGKDYFDEQFFLYKEDLDICLHLKSVGWRLVLYPKIYAYHCRGWNKNRKLVPRRIRLTAAKNEVLLYKKWPSIYYLWAYIKYLYVLILNR